MTYSDEVLADSPLVYWRLGEASGTTATDASGNGHDGTYNNTPTLGVAGALVGDADTAATFVAASSEDVRVAYFAALNITTFTMEAWYKGTGTTQVIMGRHGTSSAAYTMLVGASGELRCDIKFSGTSGNTYSGTATINDDVWHHVAIVRDGTIGAATDLWLYIDGALDASFDSVTPATNRSDGLAVASRGGTPFLNGSVDESALYTAALSGTRITAHYDAGTTLTLTPADSAHAHTAESPALTQTHELAPNDSAHGHTADSPALTQVHELAPADSAHGHATESPTLTVADLLTPADSSHGHTSESPALTQVHLLAPDDSFHAHAAEAAAFTQLHLLVAADSLHTHTSDGTTVGLAQPTPASRTSVAVADSRTSTATASSRTSTSTLADRTSSN